jgi:hypothetical protein
LKIAGSLMTKLCRRAFLTTNMQGKKVQNNRKRRVTVPLITFN